MFPALYLSMLGGAGVAAVVIENQNNEMQNQLEAMIKVREGEILSEIKDLRHSLENDKLSNDEVETIDAKLQELSKEINEYQEIGYTSQELESAKKTVFTLQLVAGVMTLGLLAGGVPCVYAAENAIKNIKDAGYDISWTNRKLKKLEKEPNNESIVLE